MNCFGLTRLLLEPCESQASQYIQTIFKLLGMLILLSLLLKVELFNPIYSPNFVFMLGRSISDLSFRCFIDYSVHLWYYFLLRNSTFTFVLSKIYPYFSASIINLTFNFWMSWFCKLIASIILSDDRHVSSRVLWRF
jgi:hypothetical protein